MSPMSIARWISDLPWSILVVLGILMALAPLRPRPHLIEKLQMLFSGTLRRPLDWFDLFLHSSPILLMIAKAILAARRS